MEKRGGGEEGGGIFPKLAYSCPCHLAGAEHSSEMA